MENSYLYNDILKKLTVVASSEESMIEFDNNDKKEILNAIHKLSYDELVNTRDCLLSQVKILKEIVHNSFELDIHCLALGNLDEFIIPIGREVLILLEDKFNETLRYEDCNAFFMS